MVNLTRAKDAAATLALARLNREERPPGAPVIARTPSPGVQPWPVSRRARGVGLIDLRVGRSMELMNYPAGGTICHDDLMAAFRQRVVDLDTTGESIDAVAGLPDRYAQKILAPVPIREIGRKTLGPLLSALGLRLTVSVDDEMVMKYASRLAKRKMRRSASDSLLAVPGPKRSRPKSLRSWHTGWRSC